MLCPCLVTCRKSIMSYGLSGRTGIEEIRYCWHTVDGKHGEKRHVNSSKCWQEIRKLLLFICLPCSWWWHKCRWYNCLTWFMYHTQPSCIDLANIYSTVDNTFTSFCCEIFFWCQNYIKIVPLMKKGTCVVAPPLCSPITQDLYWTYYWVVTILNLCTRLRRVPHDHDHTVVLQVGDSNLLLLTLMSQEFQFSPCLCSSNCLGYSRSLS